MYTERERDIQIWCTNMCRTHICIYIYIYLLIYNNAYGIYVLIYFIGVSFQRSCVWSLQNSSKFGSAGFVNIENHWNTPCGMKLVRNRNLQDLRSRLWRSLIWIRRPPLFFDSQTIDRLQPCIVVRYGGNTARVNSIIVQKCFVSFSFYLFSFVVCFCGVGTSATNHWFLTFPSKHNICMSGIVEHNEINSSCPYKIYVCIHIYIYICIYTYSLYLSYLYVYAYCPDRERCMYIPYSSVVWFPRQTRTSCTLCRRTSVPPSTTSHGLRSTPRPLQLAWTMGV